MKETMLLDSEAVMLLDVFIHHHQSVSISLNTQVLNYPGNRMQVVRDRFDIEERVLRECFLSVSMDMRVFQGKKHLPSI